jgi:hypothetical protein
VTLNSSFSACRSDSAGSAGHIRLSSMRWGGAEY